ncbi:unnamed protein product, partial [Vitrella brassicaformis CCMP3155]
HFQSSEPSAFIRATDRGEGHREHFATAIKSCFAFDPADRPTAKEVLAKLGISSSAAPAVPPAPVSPADVSPISPTSGVHTSMASTTTGLPSTVSPAQIKPVVPSKQTASPGQPNAPAKSPPNAPQPQRQTKSADTVLTTKKIKRRNIYSAVRAGDVTSVAQLIKLRGPSILDNEEVTCFCCIGGTPFTEAAKRGHVGIMSVMCESNPDVLQQLTKDRVAAVNQLLEWNPKSLDARNERGFTPFIKAAYDGNVDVMTVLHAKGGEKLLTQTDNDEDTALHWAAYYGRSAAVSQLLEWGGSALLDIRDKIDDTPFFMAAKGGNVDVLKAMLEWGGGALLNIKTTRYEGERTPWDMPPDRKPKKRDEIREIMKKYK